MDGRRRRIFPPLVAGILTLILWVTLTGGLHLDGLADCCDGLLASTTVERRLEIMKDPRLGAFGGIGLLLVLMLKAATLSSLTPQSGFGIILTASLARWCILPAGLLPLARPSGMGADFKAGFPPVVHCRWSNLSAWLGIRPRHTRTGFTCGWADCCRSRSASCPVPYQRLVTGDVFGMTVEVVEVVSLLAFTVTI